MYFSSIDNLQVFEDMFMDEIQKLMEEKINYTFNRVYLYVVKADLFCKITSCVYCSLISTILSHFGHFLMFLKQYASCKSTLSMEKCFLQLSHALSYC